MSTNITVIGAGSVVFSLGLVKDLCLTPGLEGSRVCLMDIDDERLEVVYRLAQRYAEDLGARLQVVRTLDREAALHEADFVINTAGVPRKPPQARTRSLARVPMGTSRLPGAPMAPPLTVTTRDTSGRPVAADLACPRTRAAAAGGN